MVIPFELITQAVDGDKEVEIHEYAWLGDETHGGFNELVLDKSPRLKALRYDLENADLKVLNEKASEADASEVQAMHSSDHPKKDIIEALM